jgi:hypothetical protein
VLLFLVLTGGEKSSRCNRKMASVTFSSFDRQQEKSASVDMMKLTILPPFLLHLELKLPLKTRPANGIKKMEDVVFQRKS